MNASGCKAPIDFSTLVEYWLGELDDAACQRIDEHVLGCGECSGNLAAITALSSGIRTVFREGAVRAFVTDEFVKRLAEQGVRVREYRVPRNGSVNCSVAHEDEVLIARLEAPLSGVSRVDAIFYLPETPPEVFSDIPFDAASGEVVVTPKIASIRAMPAHRQRIRLVAVEAGGERVIGDYTFNHSPSKPYA